MAHMDDLTAFWKQVRDHMDANELEQARELCRELDDENWNSQKPSLVDVSHAISRALEAGDVPAAKALASILKKMAASESTAPLSSPT